MTSNHSLKGNPHRALPLPLDYIVMLGNGSRTDFQASPRQHRPALAADADFLLFLFRNRIRFLRRDVNFGEAV